jgi:hypothetical protein
MKNIKYIAGLILVLTLLSACEEETYEFGDLISPSITQFDVEIVGSDTNPLGDGSGTVNITAAADNALVYRFVHDGAETSAPSGTITYNFKASEGPSGSLVETKQIITVVVYGAGGVSSSESIEFDILAPVAPALRVEDFENGTPGDLRTFPDVDKGEIVANPNISGINESENVMKFTKVNGAANWAGIAFENGLIDMVGFNKISLKVLSPKAGIKMVLKLETPAGGDATTYEAEGSIDKSGEWVKVVFDFSGAPEDVDFTDFVIFFDTWVDGDGSVYHFDDVELLN